MRELGLLHDPHVDSRIAPILPPDTPFELAYAATLFLYHDYSAATASARASVLESDLFALVRSLDIAARAQAVPEVSVVDPFGLPAAID